MKYTIIKVLCGAVATVSILSVSPARADPPAADGGGAPQRADLQHPRPLHGLHDGGKPPEAEHMERPQGGELSEDERRALRHDLERADREIYRK